MEYFDLFTKPPQTEPDGRGPFAKLFPESSSDGSKPAAMVMPPPSMATPPEWAQGLVKAAASPITDAGSYLGGLLGGQIPFHPAEAIQQAVTLGSSMVGPKLGGAGAFSAMFAGPLAKTADRSALNLAEKMAERGFDRRQIWDASGWFQGADKKWRFEIPDEQAAFRQKSSKLGDSLDHDAMYAAYPEMREIKMLYGEPPNTGAYYESQGGMPPKIAIPGYDPYSQRSVTLHEGQHDIQRTEGFARGGRLFRHPSGIRTREEVDAYRNLAGEVEARNVQNRSTMTPAERRATPPWQTEDIPLEQQIVRGAN